MFIIIVVALLFGIWRYRSAKYFMWVAITFVWMFVSTLLLNGGGTLEDPSGDGFITHQVRVAANDGPMMGLFAIFIVVFLWGGIIYFLNRARKAGKALQAANEAALDHPDYVEQEDADTGRKLLETVGLLLAAAAWFYFNFTALMSARNAPATVASAPTAQAPAQPTIEQEVMGVAAEINAGTPRQLDADTVLERATASGRTLTYHHKLKGRATDREELRSFILRTVVPKVCTGELRPSMKQHGVSYAYSYTASDLDEPVAITVDEKMCEGLEP
ncbi:hypothetical protein [Sphingomonas sp.]|uniref:hypothetical protein n=1 Tax=Sphingomonas sp. TaxID=28214 RepID=UPI0017B7282D|nr:hypothetical protein [Sphingomonas sp.]MBA3511850.1 hypothetical protein [Sphingomonas sp.]